MNKAQKTKLADDLKERFSKAKVAYFADYKGLSATQADELRKQLRAQNVYSKVVKNNIARLVTRDGQFGEEVKNLVDGLVGPTLVAFGFGDPAAIAKTISKFAKDNEAFKLKESLLGNKKISVSEIEELGQLPSKEVLLAKFLGSLNAPISNFVGVLAAVPRSLLNVLVAVEKKKSEQV